MRDYKIRRFRSEITKWGLIIFASIAFIYSNMIFFFIMAERGVEVPRVLIYIFRSWPYWIMTIGLTYVFAIFNFLWEDHKRRKQQR